MNTTNDYQFDVSADGSKKEDPVLTFLKETLEEKPGVEITKFLLYGNPNSSGMVTQSTNSVTLAARDAAIADFTKRVQETYSVDRNRGFVSDKDFNYEGLEKPINKVNIPTRVGHAISSYLNFLDIAYLIAAKIHVETALGNVWPKREHKDGKIVKIEGEPSINRTSVRSLIARCQSELAKELPTIIDGMYTNKFRSIGAFTYSLAEIRCFQVEPSYIKAAAEWIIQETKVSPKDQATFGEIHAGSQYDTGVSLVATPVTHPRLSKAFEEWSKITYATRSGAPKYPELLDKFARTFATRLGKNLFSKDDAKYKNASLVVVNDLIRLFDSSFNSRESSQSLLYNLKTQTKQKNEFQDNMRNCILEYFDIQYNNSIGVQNLSTVIQFMNYVLFERMSNNVPKYQAINMDIHLVYVDRLMGSTSELKKLEVYETLESLRNSNGIVNERTTNAILRFFAVKSDYDHRQKVSRKKLPHAIDQIVASLPNLSKIKLSSDEPALILESTDYVKDQELKKEYVAFKAGSQTTGLLQKAVMSLLSAMKTTEEFDEAKILKNNPTAYESYRQTFDAARNIGNAMDEVSHLYEQYYSPYFNAIAKHTSDQEKAKKLAERQSKDREKWLRSQDQLRNASLTQGQAYVQAPVQAQAPAPVHVQAPTPAPVHVQEHHNILPVHTQHVEQNYTPHNTIVGSPPISQQMVMPQFTTKPESPIMRPESPKLVHGQEFTFNPSSSPSPLPAPSAFGSLPQAQVQMPSLPANLDVNPVTSGSHKSGSHNSGSAGSHNSIYQGGANSPSGVNTFSNFFPTA